MTEGVLKTIAIIINANCNVDDVDCDSNQRRINRSSRGAFVDYLRQNHNAFKIVKGKYGNIENPALIFNIGLNSVRRLARDFNQSGFVYVAIQNDGTADYGYYDKQNGYSTPTQVKHTINSLDNPDDFYTEISREFSVNIPFEFDVCIEKASNTIIERCNGNEDLMKQRLNESINASAYRAWICRAMLYGDNGLEL